MALFGWLRRLFTHTAATPPAMSQDYKPAGLDRADPPEMVAPPATPQAGALEAPPVSVGPTNVVHVERVDFAAADRAGCAPPEQPQVKPRPRSDDGLGEALDEDVYGIAFAIEYSAADGSFSRRRIMLRSLSSTDDGVTYLRAHCFERSAPRTFRLDRVRAIIDADGVVHDEPLSFLRDELRVSVSSGPDENKSAAHETRAGAAMPRGAAAAPFAANGNGADKAGLAQRRAARDGLRILCALARADGMLHPSEAETVLDYIEAVCRVEGVPCTADDRVALAAYVRRQRPGPDVLDGCLRRLEAGPPAARALVLDHAERLIRADGCEHDAELRLLAEIRRAG